MRTRKPRRRCSLCAIGRRPPSVERRGAASESPAARGRCHVRGGVSRVSPSRVGVSVQFQKSSHGKVEPESLL
eukprot:636610-Prymnesium_polylepis.1